MPVAEPAPELEIGPMIRPELDAAVDAAAAEGWNPGLSDADAFWAADAGGFWVGRLDGRLVATLSAVRYEPDFAFLGFYLVAPGHRHEGKGLALWRHVVDRLGDRVLGLDGVVAQEATYARDGFRTAWRNQRRRLDEPGSLRPSGATAGLAEVGFGELVADDARLFPAERRAFLKAWLAMPGAMGRAVVDGSGAGRLRGWGLVRPCREGSKVGPLVADDAEVADALLRDLAAAAPPGPLHLDVPGGNPAAGALADAHAMAPVFETVRMYRGTPPERDEHRLFGVTTFELG